MLEFYATTNFSNKIVHSRYLVVLTIVPNYCNYDRAVFSFRLLVRRREPLNAASTLQRTAKLHALL